MKKQNIEVEGGELLIQSKEGHYAVIPAKHRQEVMDMVKDGCDDCVNNYIQTLPKDSDYAEDGSLYSEYLTTDSPNKKTTQPPLDPNTDGSLPSYFEGSDTNPIQLDEVTVTAEAGSLLPDWDTVTATLNPYNWGVTNYSDKGDFNTAYSTARKAGEKEFLFNNKRYNTNYKGTPQQQLKETGITNKQIGATTVGKNLANNLYPAGYSTVDNTVIDKTSKTSLLKRVYNAAIKNKVEMDRFDADDAINYPEDNPYFKGIIEQRYKDRIDYNNLYFGLPQKYNTKRISKYKPSNSKDNNSVEYYTSDLIQQRLNGLLAFNNSEVKRSVQPGDNSNTGSYTLDSGKDDRGKYYSFYDKWDLSPFGTGKDESLGIGKPIEIYDRLYYKDYGDGNNKRMYYTDKELSQLDINKKDFDTLALQRELSNRGYKLPKSTKQDGSFDGIWGDETKNALLDYQIKNKTK